MKIKALASICTEAKALLLADGPDGSQWAGTEAALWKLPENLGRLSPEAMCAIFDISPEKAAKMRIQNLNIPDTLDASVRVDGEKELLYWMNRRILMDGNDLMPLKAPGGEIFFINFKWLKPGADAEQPSLCLRQAGGDQYIVYKDGLFVEALIGPLKPGPEQTAWIADVCAGMTL